MGIGIRYHKKLSCSEVFACSFVLSHALHYYCTHESMLDVYCVCVFHVLPPHHLRLDLFYPVILKKNTVEAVTSPNKNSDGTSVLKSTSEIPIPFSTQSVIPLSYTLYHLGKDFECLLSIRLHRSAASQTTRELGPHPVSMWYTP